MDFTGDVSRPAPGEHHTLVFAPHGRDAEHAETLLREIGIQAAICASLPDVHAALADTTCCVVLAEEAVRDADLSGLGEWVAGQPCWSDLPMVVLCDRDGGPERDPLARRLSDMLGNVSFLERPFHPTSFISLISAALKARRHQHRARAQLHALQHHQQRLGMALAAGRLHSWNHDPVSGQLTASDGCKALFGHPPEHPFNVDDLHASVHEMDRASLAELLTADLEHGRNHARECRAIRPDDSQRWIELRVQVLTSITGGILLAGVAADITARKQAEAADAHTADAHTPDAHTNETIERQVRCRTARLQADHRAELERMSSRHQTEEQLRQVQKIETIGQLTGGVAHDFNNLLMVVLGNLQLMQKRLPDDPRLGRLLDGAVQGARRGALLTQRLLAFARRQDLRPSSVDLVALVSGMHERLGQSAGPGINVVVDLPASLPVATADRSQVESALLNLVANARDAMSAGGTVFIKLQQAEHPRSDDLAAGSYVGISVCDTGAGMDGHTLKRAVEPFFSTKELGKGTGLGLSMVHGLAVQLHGALRLFSRPDVGTCAELWLPVAIGPMPVVPAARADDAAPSNARILVVDDDSLVSAGTAMMLEDLGHAVTVAGSGREAMAVLRGDAAIDLMITDYAMPQMSGLELVQAARAVRPGLLVLLATGYAELPDGVGNDLPRLGKPYSQEQLAEQLRALLAGLPKPTPGA